MLHEITCGGKSRPVLFGNYAFRKMAEESKLLLTTLIEDVGESNTVSLPVAFYHAFRAGEVAKGITADTYDVDMVAIWLDMEQGATDKMYGWLLYAIRDMSKETLKAIAKEGEAEEKKSKSRPI
jgi:hypothetical protein